MPPTPPPLPAAFFLRIRGSGSLILLQSQGLNDGSWRLTISPKVPYTAGAYTVPHTSTMTGTTNYRGKYTFLTDGPGGAPVVSVRHVYTPLATKSDGGTWPAIAKAPGGYAIPILEFSKHTGIFKGRRLIPNTHTVEAGATQYIDMSGSLISAGSAVAVADSSGNTFNVIQHVAAPAPKGCPPMNVRPKKVPKPTGDLAVHVARQLLELAQLKKEQCPITVEDYITGQTAVMPCGHLFMQMAIEETFKKEPNSCPWCRQYGRPTFV